jgi:hypothetical protein
VKRAPQRVEQDEEEEAPPSPRIQPGWRIGRLVYLVQNILHGGAALICGALGLWSGYERWVFFALGLPLTIAAVRARLRDMGEADDGWWPILIPLYNVYFGARLVFTERKNSKAPRTAEFIPGAMMYLVVVSLITFAFHTNDPPKTAVEEPPTKPTSTYTYTPRATAPVPTSLWVSAPSGLNIHSAPSVDAPTIATLQPNTEVTSIGRTSGSFTNVNAGTSRVGRARNISRRRRRR